MPAAPSPCALRPSAARSALRSSPTLYLPTTTNHLIPFPGARTCWSRTWRPQKPRCWSWPTRSAWPQLRRPSLPPSTRCCSPQTRSRSRPRSPRWPPCWPSAARRPASWWCAACPPACLAAVCARCWPAALAALSAGHQGSRQQGATGGGGHQSGFISIIATQYSYLPASGFDAHAAEPE
jgi:hypothetical protein